MIQRKGRNLSPRKIKKKVHQNDHKLSVLTMEGNETLF